VILEIVASTENFNMVGTITTMNSKDLIKQLQADGWVLRGSKGSHHVYVHVSKPGHISVPHPKKDLGVGLLHKLLKQAGLNIKE
jgi:predicted RNA binding protein YcfA (HicA-like mRNA interferase family)